MLLWHNKSTVLQPQDTSITVNVSVINNKTRDLEREPEDKVEFQQTDTGSENCYAAIHLNQTTIHTPYKIYIYDLPTKYNKNLLGCRHHMFHFEQCVYGPTLHKEPGVIFTDTCQFTLDVILHHNLLFSPYRTLNPEEADVFYVPFYGAVHCFCRSGEQLESRLITEINRFPYYRQGKPHILSVGKIEKEQSSTTCPLLLQEWTWNTTALGIESYYFKRLPLTDEKRHRMRNAPRGYPKFVVVPYPSYVHFDEPSGGHYHNGIYSHKRRVFVFLAAGDGRFNPFRNIIVDKLPTKTRMSPEAYYTSEQHPATRNLSNMWLIVPGSGMLVNTTIQWMRESVFCLQPPGYSPTRKSIYDGILCGCIPVFFEWDYIPIVNYPFQVSYCLLLLLLISGLTENHLYRFM